MRNVAPKPDGARVPLPELQAQRSAAAIVDAPLTSIPIVAKIKPPVPGVPDHELIVTRAVVPVVRVTLGLVPPPVKVV